MESTWLAESVKREADWINNYLAKRENNRCETCFSKIELEKARLVARAASDDRRVLEEALAKAVEHELASWNKVKELGF